MQYMFGLIHLYFLELSTDILTFFVKFCWQRFYFQILAQKKIYKLSIRFTLILLQHHV